MDAIDVCLLRVENGKPLELKDFSSRPISKSLKNIFLSLLEEGSNELEISQLASVDFSLEISAILNLLLRRNHLDPREILGVGVHGQTVRHNPKQLFTIQLCNPAIISERTKLTVVSDFRSKDIAAGGEGAPLAPLFHNEICKNYAPCVVVNIGGVSNITVIAKCKKTGSKITKGFDTGPGNCLSDLWCSIHFKKSFDENGNLAKSGTFDNKLLDAMLLDPYFSTPPPKSTGLNYFNESWLKAKIRGLKNKISKKDILATLIELTALTIVANIPKKIDTLYVCGGGVKNSFLLERIEKTSKCKIHSISKIGWDPQMLESACFAWLASKILNNETVDLRMITGSKKPVKLGNITFY